MAFPSLDSGQSDVTGGVLPDRPITICPVVALQHLRKALERDEKECSTLMALAVCFLGLQYMTVEDVEKYGLALTQMSSH